MVDMGDYRAFLADPQPTHLWVGPPIKKRQQDWKPFTGPLSLRSRRFSETVINGLFTFLVNQHYLLHNPLTALAKLKNPNALRPIDTNRSFNEDQWQLIQSFLDTQATNADGGEKLKWLRTRMIIQLAYGTGLRLHELANAKLGDLEARQRQGQTQHWLMVLGKGQKWRDVPIPLPLYRLMAETYQQLTGRQLNRPAPDNPIIPPLRGSASNPLTPLAIHKAIKEAFTIAANTLSITNPEAAEKLFTASAHWLRHTHGSMAVDRNIPLTMIRDNLGHSNIATTSSYVHSDNDARHDAFVKEFS
jgi:integrase